MKPAGFERHFRQGKMALDGLIGFVTSFSNGMRFGASIGVLGGI
jgi:hypothetical protein